MTRLIALNDRFWPVLTVALLFAVTLLSLIPLPQMQGPIGGNDKLQHLIAYGALAGPVALARPQGWRLLLAGAALCSGGIELVQPLVNRSTHPADIAANLAGLALGALAAAGLRRLPGAHRPPDPD